MSGREGDSKVPFVAGVFVGAGVMTLLYFLFDGQKNEGETTTEYYQKIKAPFKCICRKIGLEHLSLLSSAEEAERKRRQRLQVRQKITEPSTQDIHAIIAASSPPPSKYSKRFILGLSALLCGCVAALFSSLDRKTTRRILTVFGLGWLMAEKRRQFCGPPCPTIDSVKRRWPLSETKPAVLTKEREDCCTCEDDE